ncbi:MAG: toxic anion resistance protein [Gammaproteobacteria bacterium]|nr:toxic anion resistance protein [Gammaproteobacteria bacterium]MCP5198221.1 toxic anion resistance protein [Gammaproteobacteria bacterium]
MSALELTPPEVLTPPAPVASVAPEQAHNMVKLDPETVASLNTRVREFVSAMLTLPPHSDEFKDKIANIHNLGAADIRAAANVSNRMLQRPTQALNSGLFDDGAPISRTLTDLRKTVENLDPSRQGDLFAPKKLFGIIPFGNRLRDYFLQYQSAQSHINAILQALYNGQDELRKDNAAIEQEKANLWAMMQKLEQYVYVGKQLDSELENHIHEIEAQNAEKARIVKEEALFYLRQKVQDLLTQLAVSVQGYLALDMIRKNNLELIKGVDRATTTTVSALRTAVIVAQALANQKLVLDQINALNATTSNLIESTSALLKQQSAQIQQQAASATVNPNQLKTAFANIYQAMELMSDYKVKALDNMRLTVDTLSNEVEKAREYVARAQEADTIIAATPAATNDLVL